MYLTNFKCILSSSTEKKTSLEQHELKKSANILQVMSEFRKVQLNEEGETRGLPSGAMAQQKRREVYLKRAVMRMMGVVVLRRVNHVVSFGFLRAVVLVVLATCPVGFLLALLLYFRFLQRRRFNIISSLNYSNICFFHKNIDKL